MGYGFKGTNLFYFKQFIYKNAPKGKSNDQIKQNTFACKRLSAQKRYCRTKPAQETFTHACIHRGCFNNITFQIQFGGNENPHQASCSPPARQWKSCCWEVAPILGHHWSPPALSPQQGCWWSTFSLCRFCPPCLKPSQWSCTGPPFCGGCFSPQFDQMPC